jgi:hypothetical protein
LTKWKFLSDAHACCPFESWDALISEDKARDTIHHPRLKYPYEYKEVADKTVDDLQTDRRMPSIMSGNIPVTIERGQ